MSDESEDREPRSHTLHSGEPPNIERQGQPVMVDIGIDSAVALTLAVASLGIIITVIGVLVATGPWWAPVVYAVGSLVALWLVLFRGRTATIRFVQRRARRELKPEHR